MQYSGVQYSEVQYSTLQYSEVQYSTSQYNTIEYSTVQYSTDTLDMCVSIKVLTLRCQWRGRVTAIAVVAVGT